MIKIKNNISKQEDLFKMYQHHIFIDWCYCGADDLCEIVYMYMFVVFKWIKVCVSWANSFVKTVRNLLVISTGDHFGRCDRLSNTFQQEPLYQNRTHSAFCAYYCCNEYVYYEVYFFEGVEHDVMSIHT